MSLKRDSVTEWTKTNGEAIANHRSQPLPKTAGGIFGGSVFGLASRTLGITAPSLLGRLSPTDLFDGKALLGAGKDYLLSKAGAAINGALAGTSRQWLEGQDHHNLLGRTTGFRFNHDIENKGYLSFAFPEGSYNDILTPAIGDTITVGTDDFNTFTLPFFENPKITESRSSEYASHKIVNRNEPYRLWTGAKPLKVSLSFNITLPHLMTFAVNHIKQICGEVISTDDFKNFIINHIKENISNTNNDAEENNFLESFQIPNQSSITANFLKNLSSSNDFYELSNKILTDMSHPAGLGNTESDRARLIIYCTYLINLIRSSVLGSSNTSSEDEKDPENIENSESSFIKAYLPAPVIFLTYGSMYNNSPFIATNYSITFDGKSGYEELSLLPRVIQIKLTLESFNQFEDSDKIFGVPKLFASPKI